MPVALQAWALGVTVVSESAAFCTCVPLSKRLRFKMVWGVVLLNLVSHTLFWAATSPRHLTLGELLLAEGIVVLLEAAVYAGWLRLSPLKAIALALLLNAASLIAGDQILPYV